VIWSDQQQTARRNAIKPLPDLDLLRALFVLDMASGKLFERGNRNARAKEGKEVGGIPDRHGYRTCQIEGEKYYVHRIVWKMAYGIDPPILNHRDLHKALNQLDNLRPTNKTLSSAASPRAPTYGRGVAHDPRNKKHPWLARISVQKRRITIGWFSTLQAARDAYDEAAIRHFGEFARLNRNMFGGG
jgi:hypothetical protein